jgi:peptide/nickel transport system substrate-binding protein
VVDGVGKYGGTLNVFATANHPWNTMTESTERNHYMLQFMEDGSIVGDVVRAWSMTDDGMSFTFFLRKGLKWSDGEPFTAEDIVFTYEDMNWNDNVPGWNMISEIKRIRALDDLAVVMETDEPTYSIQPIMAQWHGGNWVTFHPKHYVQKWHIRYNDDADTLADYGGEMPGQEPPEDMKQVKSWVDQRAQVKFGKGGVTHPLHINRWGDQLYWK